MAETVLSIEHVAVHFGGLVAISDMNFHVDKGEIVSLIGPNGAGKTTAFNVMTGFLTPTKGAVNYCGADLKGKKPHEIADLGLIRTFQRTSVFPNDTVYDNVLIGLHRQGELKGKLGLAEAIPRPAARPRIRRKPSARARPKWCAGSASKPRQRSCRLRCPTASSASSVSRWRSPRSRRCCCWTSLCPA